MKSYEVSFRIDVEDSIIIEASSEEEAERKFHALDSIDLSYYIDIDNDGQVYIDYIEEVEED